MIKWLKEGYTDAIKKIIAAHKWAFHKSLWGTIFILPYVFAESIIIYIILGFLWNLFGSGEPPSSPIIGN